MSTVLLLSLSFSLHIFIASSENHLVSISTMKIAFTQLFLCASLVNGFIFPADRVIQQKAGLQQLVDSQPNQRLSINLDIGNAGDNSRLAVKGLILDLQNDVSDCQDISMPGKHGLHPDISSGIRKLDVAEEGRFISKIGTQVVHVANSCWEMIWTDNAHSGFLICGLDVSEEYQRNEAKLPKGQTYISFTCWTQETLKEVQRRKQQILDRAEKYQQKKREELKKMEATNNIFLKMKHYSNACTAAFNCSFEPLQGINQVPDSVANVIKIHDDLFIHPTGLVWSQSQPRGKQIVLGSAGLVPVSVKV